MVRRVPRQRSFRTRSHRIPAMLTPPPSVEPPSLVEYFNRLSPDQQLQLIHELQGEMLELYHSVGL